MQENEKLFLIEEYKALRTEIDNIIKRMQTLIPYALLSSGAFWVWFVDERPSAWWVLFIPAVLSALLGIHSCSYLLDLNRFNRYLIRVEKTFGISKGLGWETQLNKKTQLNREIKWTAYSDFLEIVFWIVIFVGNLLLAYCLF